MKLWKILLVIFASVGIDQLSKYIVSINFKLHEPYELIENFYYITYYKNSGIAFGMFDNMGMIIIVISIVLLLLLLYELWQNYKDKISALAFSFLIGGLIGNLIDRISFGYVRDFLDFNPFGYNFPIFNVSDACIVIGAILLMINIFSIGEKHEEVKSNK